MAGTWKFTSVRKDLGPQGTQIQAELLRAVHTVWKGWSMAWVSTGCSKDPSGALPPLPHELGATSVHLGARARGGGG